MKVKDRPEGRIAYVVRGVDYCRVEVEKWKVDHDDLADSLWVGEDFVEKTDRLFVRILELDDDIQGRFLRGEMPYDQSLADKLAALLPDWLDLARTVVEIVKPLEADYGSVRGVVELRDKVWQAALMMKTDDEVFRGPGLDRLRDEAIKDHRAGLTESMHADACR